MMVESKKKRRVALNNDGTPLTAPQMEAPIGVDGLVQQTIKPLLGTHITTLYWTLGTDVGIGGYPTCRFSNIYSHDTKIGQRWGMDQEKFESADNWRAYENTSQLIKEGKDPPKVLIEHGHRHNLEVLISLRMNDSHDGLAPGWGHTEKDAHTPMHFTVNKMKRDHPEWLLGPTEGIEVELHRYNFDFAVEQVRDFKLSLIEETCEKYDLDGLDLDFCRYPRFFKPNEEQDNAHFLTDFVEQVREILNRTGRMRNKHLLLSVRALPTFEINRKVGIELKTWLDSGWVDILISGTSVGCMQRLPVEEYIEVCRHSETAVLAHIGISPAWGHKRGLVNRGVPYLEGACKYYTDSMFRAIAASYWQAGVDGLYLWNNHLIEYFDNPNWGRHPWREIGDPELISRMNKHYLIDHDMGMLPVLGKPECALRPPAELPAELSDQGEPATVRFDIADGFEKVRADGEDAEVTLRMRISQMTGADQLRFLLNGLRLNQSAAKTYIDWNEYWLDFEVSSIIKQGMNELVAVVESRNPNISVPLVLQDVETIVRYSRNKG